MDSPHSTKDGVLLGETRKMLRKVDCYLAMFFLLAAPATIASFSSAPIEANTTDSNVFSIGELVDNALLNNEENQNQPADQKNKTKALAESGSGRRVAKIPSPTKS